MSPIFDCMVSSLLCGEDNESIFNDNDDTVVEFEATWQRGVGSTGTTQHNGSSSVFGGCGGLLPVMSEECLVVMVEKESQHQPHVDYLKSLRTGCLELGARQEALDWMEKAHAHFGFGPLCAYLSVNYLDRFLSAYELPKGKAWMMQLLAVACLSLAAKMEETDVPLCLDLQVGESKFIFEARTIQRMELLVLSTLRWRMQAITPFTFIDYFFNKIYDNEEPPKALILQSVQIILSTIRDIDFLEFRPSEIAAAVAIAVVGETKTADTEQAISVLTRHVEKERVMKCINKIKNLALMGGAGGRTSGSVLSVPHSPIGVLDAACLSYKSDELTVGSCTNYSQHTPTTKRRKLNRPCEV